LKKIALLVVLVVIVGGGAFLYYPRGGASSLSAAVAATLAILNTDITAQRGGTGDFGPALDGDVFASGDVVKSSQEGRAVLTFFDGSTLTVETGSMVKVTQLNHLDNGGIQLTIEQTLGRTWASVSKLKTPDSRFEIRTPTSTATVRGTAFETLVTRGADGGVTVTYKTDEGEVLVSANAGGQTSVTPNTQVTIGQNQPAPNAPSPIPPGPSLRLTGGNGLGFAVMSPSGASCGSAGNRSEIPGCVVNGNVATIRAPGAGRYVVLATAATALGGATLRVDALRGTTVESTQTFTRTLAAGDLVRTAFTYGAGTPLTVGAFEPAELVTSVCGALGRGRVFSGGTLQERSDLLSTFGSTNHNADVAFVATQAELNAEIARQLAANPNVPVKDVSVTVDPAGVHFSGQVTTPVGGFTTSGDASLGQVNGRLTVRIRSLSAGPVPAALLDQVRSQIETNTGNVADSMPFVVKQVALRSGCFVVIGATR